jgi:two-component system, OmpR family, phosphate regulon sensor histidine kinase PhoR
MNPPESKYFTQIGGILVVILFIAGLILSQFRVLLLVAPFVLGLLFLGRKAISEQEAHIKRQDEKNNSILGLLDTQKSAVDAFAHGLDAGVFVCDNKAQIRYANTFAQSLFGFENPIGRSILAVTLSVELEQVVLKTSSTSEKIEQEMTFSFPKERVCRVSAWTTEQTPGQIYLSLVEVTEMRRLERVRRDFVANVSHELRTPLTVIRAYSETMLDDDDKDLRGRYLTRIVNEVDRLSSLTQDLLILSTAESSPIRKGACDLGGAIRYALTLLKSSAEEKGLSLEYRGPECLLIEANSSQINQVVLNLVENALKYTSEGGVLVELSSNDLEVRFDVTDTGLGIAVEHLPRLFERFYRVDKGRSRSNGGTGLGLSIVKHIVEAHGGTIKVDSSLNEGSTFSVTLPIGNL